MGETRKAKVKAMSHEERIAFAKKLNAAGMGMIVSGMGCCIGLTAGLWGSIGAGAIGVGFGSASGLFFGSCGPFQYSKQVLMWDEEFEQQKQQANVATVI